MPPGQMPDRGAKNRFATVTFPAGRSGTVRTLSFTRWGLLSGASMFILIVVALTVAAILYTPVGRRLPTADQDLEKQYGRQIAGIQAQLQDLTKEMNTL